MEAVLKPAASFFVPFLGKIRRKRRKSEMKFGNEFDTDTGMSYKMKSIL